MPKHPKLEFLWLGDQESQGVRNTIRQRRFEQIANEVNLQRNRLMMSPREPQRAVEGDNRSLVRG